MFENTAETAFLRRVGFIPTTRKKEGGDEPHPTKKGRGHPERTREGSASTVDRCQILRVYAQEDNLGF